MAHKTADLSQPDDKGDHHPFTGPAIKKGQSMPRAITSLKIDDLSTFTRTLRQSLIREEGTPGHSKMLTLVAKAAGYQNYQHLKAAKPAAKPADSKQLEKALRVFDANGIMIRWPNQTAVQGLCLWVFWTQLPARTDLTEKQINTILTSGNSFGDHALLRRSLIDHRLAERTTDGKTYRRIERAPPPEALQLIAAVQRPS
ncbi:DUF2087 domain-containing protein [Yoonia sp. 2307UL14-13]|uniref:DUF2087 domain-containing protein n=1 Tax=Yoonia sp. 2307UL14-13 TaxID=3126506 RepID=UPI00309C8CBF